MPVVAANGLEIGYDVVGAGPPAVWLHGATSLGADDFAAQLPLFSKSFRIYLPDDTAAQFSPQTQRGCSNAGVVLMEIGPFAR